MTVGGTDAEARQRPAGILGPPPMAMSTERGVAVRGERGVAVREEQRLRSWTGRPRPSWTHGPGRAPRPEDAGWWWLGVHGGAGVTTLDGWLPGGVDAHRMWPDPDVVGPSLVVLVARTHVAGLTRAAWALRQAAAGDVPSGVRVAGVVVVADGPSSGFGRPQEEALRRLRGIAPHMWLIPWIDELRLVVHSAELGPPPPQIVALFHDLASLVETDLEHRSGH